MGTYQLPGQPWKTGMYQDAASVDFAQVQDHKIHERRLLDCVPLKGLSAWAATGSRWKLASETAAAAQAGVPAPSQAILPLAAEHMISGQLQA